MKMVRHSREFHHRNDKPHIKTKGLGEVIMLFSLQGSHFVDLHDHTLYANHCSHNFTLQYLRHRTSPHGAQCSLFAMPGCHIVKEEEQIGKQSYMFHCHDILCLQPFWIDQLSYHLYVSTMMISLTTIHNLCASDHFSDANCTCCASEQIAHKQLFLRHSM